MNSGLCESCINVLASRTKPPPQLPDDVLLEVFRWLPTRALLRDVRAVCRRWRDLALQPSLWSRRSLSGGSANNSELRAVLRHVPCLYSLKLAEFNEKSVDTYDAASRTNCAVTKLTVRYPKENVISGILLIIGRVMQRQLDTGRLQSLCLMNIPREEAGAVLKIAMTGHFTELSVVVSGEPGEEQPLAAPSTPFDKIPPVKTLSYSSATRDPMQEYLLKTVAPTLETVELLDTAVTGRALKLVNKCPRLRAAELPSHKHIAGLSACPLLTDLTLDLSEPSLPQLVPYLRRAVRLTRLSLPFPIRGEGAYHELDVRALLAALSSSGRSSLKELTMVFMVSAHHRISPLPELPAFLRGLPMLHTLSMECMPPLSALDAISPSTAPSLRLLRFTFTGEPAACMCNNACSLRNMYHLVQRNPQLHVSGLFYYHMCHLWSGFDIPCKCCEEGIHPRKEKPWDHCSLYGHSEGQKCEAASEHRGPGACPVCDKCSHQWLFVDKDTIPSLF